MKWKRKLLALLTAAGLLAASIGVIAAAADDAVCFAELADDTLRFSRDGASDVSFAVDGDGFDVTFYRYEPARQLCALFTDAAGGVRRIALGTGSRLALSGTFDTLTLSPSLGNAAFYLKSGASVNTFNVNFSGTAFVYGSAAAVVAGGPATISLQRGANVGRVSLERRGSSLDTVPGSSVSRVSRAAAGCPRPVPPATTAMTATRIVSPASTSSATSRSAKR